MLGFWFVQHLIRLINGPIAAGIELLVESYTVLIYAFLNADPIDIPTAEAVLQSMRDAGRDATAGWRMLCKQLFQKEYVREAMAAVKQGFDEELEADPDLYASVIFNLCEAGLTVSGWGPFGFTR